MYRKSNKVQSVTAIILIILMIALFPLNLYFWGIIAAIAGVVFCIFLLVMNQYMVKKNREGNAVFSELKGFRQFIKIAEERKLKMLLKEDPGYFESTMSYALAFGLFDKWAKKFDGLDVQPPTWYTSTSGNAFMMSNFSESFSKQYFICTIYDGKLAFEQFFVGRWWFFGWRLWWRWRRKLVRFNAQ